jgi:FMN-binding protein
MQMRMIIGFISLFILLAWTAVSYAGEAPDGERVYMDPQAYVAGVFDDQIPAQDTLWPSGELRAQLTEILGHAPGLRFRYWGANGKTVWILDEIGKDRPITAGVTIADGKIEDVQVLVFRESRGWEVKHNFFTRQFANLWLEENQRLSGKIDNITGATLSVKAMTRMAKAALLMHNHTGITPSIPDSAPALANAR